MISDSHKQIAITEIRLHYLFLDLRVYIVLDHFLTGLDYVFVVDSVSIRRVSQRADNLKCISDPTGK
jgi:hypothetical protein